MTTTLADLPASGTAADGSAVVRLLSYNVRSLRDDEGALTRVIRACAPDVVCVQEAPRFVRWRKHAGRLARRSGLVYVTGGATACGPMVLASLRPTVERTEDVLLPRTPGLHQRGLATAVLRFGRHARLAVVSAHLSLRRDERHAQAGLLLDRLSAVEPLPAVAAGDLNERPGGPAFRRLTARLRDGWATAPWGAEHTSDTVRPHQRIDAVLAGPGVEVLGCGVPLGLPGVTDAALRAASDHRPVLAALRVPATR
ncbi:endonuclease/exonuclease/phosphatase family protein [Streptomyces sp. TRM 70351]|uniref:endonuclease/exonuclease/phosphatase family protein n=1 Tax=Streptomyces sp. TRM 70351 TaxID=3116552 RepID=UPI002E7B8AF1|nr:endonuclease/exonuclease/phosphatase family protein [Streptomyces sp. TRM 70351]MEE1928704.1 endonuclease/exonuclease/phosphatase family protein [Streptomyces sp. TRM 70351]